ncbi:cysteine-rich CWC family protein [Pulveribacter suum]|uniref:Cysteine-rich CWC family protein n=1 Tax=Pulveribacter suum TaxID=2116657 RepID=A0A2P1NHE3_9BURK|nr:cysteine-rich CWC family protein [Pulveribacter suum]AVP56459.1 hypothetical protein C7H73_01395 [Pulveribacter suum]
MNAPAPTCCPLCGQTNTCAMAAGLPAGDCWCMDAHISPAALQRVPDALRGQACLCARCAAGEPLPPAGGAAPDGMATPSP